MAKRVYLFTRLYNIDDKLRTCELEMHLLREHGDIETYMPYRDSDEERIEYNWKTTVFDRDIIAIDNAEILIGFWDGPEFDEGVGFEIGYALAKGKQVVVLNTDFLKYRVAGSQTQHPFPDPLLGLLPILVLHETFTMSSVERFFDDLNRKKEQYLCRAALQLYNLKRTSPMFKTTPSVEFFIDCGNSLFYSQYFNRTASSMCYVSKRFMVDDVIKAAETDLSRLLSSQYAFVVANGTEMNVGSSVLCGLCYGLDIPFYIVNDRLHTAIAMKGEDMPINLMLECASNGYLKPQDLLNKIAL